MVEQDRRPCRHKPSAEAAASFHVPWHLPSFGTSFGPPEGLGVLLEPGQVAFTGLGVGVLPQGETSLQAADVQ